MVNSCNGEQTMTEMLMVSFILSYPRQNGTRRAGREKRDSDKQVADRYPSRGSEQVPALEVV